MMYLKNNQKTYGVVWNISIMLQTWVKRVSYNINVVNIL